MESKVNYKLIIPVFLAFVVLLYACGKSFLNKPPIGGLNQSTLSNRAGVEGLLIGAYSLLDGVGGAGQDDGPWTAPASAWVFGGVCSDDAHKGSDPGDQPDMVPIMTWSENSTNTFVHGKWAFDYDAIQRCNSVLRVMRLATDILPADTVEIRAEALFLRGYYAFENKKMYGNGAPWIDESVSYANNNWHVPNQKETFSNIEADLTYAMNNLPATQAQIGRANKYAAEAFLAKVFMFEHNYAAAKPLLADLIANGETSGGHPYKLINFADNFNPAKNHGDDEAIFQCQMSIDDGSGANNANAGDVLNFPYNGGPGTCCGFYQPSFSLVNAYKTDPVTGLPDPVNYKSSNIKNDQGIASSASFTPYTGTVDARLDWTVGRRGIPYLDWGLYPGASWIRNQQSAGPYAAIKNTYYKSQEGVLTDNSSWTSGYTANNYTFIRYADVLLWAAEVEVEIGSLTQAQTYVNMVRSRAANSAGWVKSIPGGANYGGFAANYKVGLYTTPWADQATARLYVQFERRLELAMEGHRFFDLVRYGTAATELNAYAAHEVSSGYVLLNAATFVAGKNEYYPVPQAEIDQSTISGKVTLKQNNGY